MIRMLHICKAKPEERVWIEAFREALRALGELELVEDGAALGESEIADRVRRCDVFLTCWQAVTLPRELAAAPGALRYICNVSGSVRSLVPPEFVESGIPITNWGDAPAGRLAEGAFALLLACLKDLEGRRRIVRQGGWKPPETLCSPVLENMRVGVYGCGEIGRRFVEMLRPFRPAILVFDPYAASLPEGCERAGSLDELFGRCEAIVIHAALSEETRGSVTAERLARLPDRAVLVNTARGAIVDQEALFAELASGRLRAGLDVLEPDRLPPGHPARDWENLILTAHDIGKNRPPEGFPPTSLDSMHRVCLDNLRRFAAGQPLRFVMDRERYERST